jgi:predicted peptidase
VSNDLALRDSFLAVYHDMITEMVAKYQPSKTYLATLSMGSRLEWRYFTLYPDAFDAALMCCGVMQNADLSAVTDKPIWFVHAVSDFVNASHNSVDAFNQLNAAGNPNVHLTLVTDDGMNGVFSHAVWQFVYGNAQHMNWLFAQ